MALTDTKKGPLAGLRVVDFGHYFAAPMTAMLLADQGASVVRVIRPGDPELPDPQFRLLNRNKKLVVLDLKTDEGRRRALDLVARADVAIESFRPGVMRRLGLDHASLQESNPRLVYLSLPGFGSADVDRAHLPGWEGVVSAAASLYTTGMRQRLNFPPLYVPAPICSAFGSMHGAIAILSALMARGEDGPGTWIEAPLVNAGISTCTRSFVYDGGKLRAASSERAKLPAVLESLVVSPEDDPDLRRKKIEQFGQMAPPIFTTHPYPTSDGRRLLIMPIKPEMAERFFEVLGLDTALKLAGFRNDSPWERVDLGLGNNLASSWTMTRENSLRLIEMISEVTATRPASHWEKVLTEARIPIGCLRTREEWLAIDALQESGMLTRMDQGGSVLTVPGPVADVSGPGGATLDPTPDEPQSIDWEEALALWGETGGKAGGKKRGRGGEDAESAPPVAPRSWRKGELLADLKVLDLCNVVAGPNAAYTLGQFGAEVIRIEPPKSFNLPMHLEWTLEVNQGKRSMVIDIGTAPGREVFGRLVRWADLVVHNRLDDVAERIGMSLEQLQEINPEVIVCQNSAFGGLGRGPWDLVPGYDPMPNLTTGLDALAGSPEKPRGMTEIFADLMGGLGTAFAGLLGLYQRRETGFAGEGRSSLARGAQFYQLPFMIDEAGNCDWRQGRGPDARGDCAWQRMYACRDAWIFVGTSEARAGSMAERVTGRSDASESDLEAAFAERDAEAWRVALEAADIGCHRVLSLDDLCDPEQVRSVDNETADEEAKGALEVLCWREHPSALPIVLPAPAWVQVGEGHSYRRLSPTPKVGAHTREILAELGYGQNEIATLYRLRVAHDRLPAFGDRDAFFFQQQGVSTS